MNTYNNEKNWYKDAVNKKLSGVCSGFARRFDFPIWATRLVTILLFIQFPLFIGGGYLAAHFCLDTKA
ncbi:MULTISPECIES: PspC domain-containing protein [unclassified Pseudoalteromonas]|uniref:PspC domain-containing protein n=1 Tax=unclassified Pseudoalteromonas TaxID=194690 RepID=UPI0025B37131|nr:MULTISPECIES: PspC domain-containing protein [unclassified Pseudoalteromonas]MDN3379599.1 PspC domain-containing protein [Pseudoalteromonas sp. APC 3893]MDN3387939.1 PspC domain-containing protein [Pseudoalteromonas sp. APC 4017]